MKPGIPWSIKGIEGKAREVAKDAARAQGMTLGEWLNQKILESASDDAELKSRATRRKSASSVSSSRARSRAKAKPPATETKPESKIDSEVARKLDMLVERLDNLDVLDTTPEPVHEPEHVLSAHRTTHDDSVDAMYMQRLLDRIEQSEQVTSESVSVLGGKVEQISNRVEEIAGNPASLKARDVPGFSALEGAVRNIVDHIEKSEKQARESINSLQTRMLELDGKVSVPAATPEKSSVIEDLEQRMQELAARVEQAAQNDQDDELKSLFETRIKELAERIDTVRHSTEAITQKAEATASKAAEEQANAVEARLAKLVEQAEQKLEEAGSSDAAAPGLQDEIKTLHARFEEIRQQSASEQEVQALRSAIEKLSSRVEDNPANEPIAQIEQRIAELSQQLQSVSQAADYQPKLGALEERIQALDSQMTTASSGEKDPELASQMAGLEQRIASTEQQLGSLSKIEASVQQLFASIEESRAEVRAMAENAQATPQAGAASGEPSAEMKALEDGLAAVKANAEMSDKRTQETLEAVHETLAQIIGKLGELDAREGGQPLAAAAVTAASMTPAADQAATADTSMMQAAAEMPEGTDPTPAPAEVDLTAAQNAQDTFSPFEAADPAAEQPAPEAQPAAPAQPADPAQQQQPSSDADWLAVVRAHMNEVHGIQPPAPQAPVVDMASPTTSDGHTDFIAAARKAASAVQPNAPAGAMMGAMDGPMNEMSMDPPQEKGKLASLFSRDKSQAVDNGAAAEDGSSRKRLLLAGAVLLAAVSAYAVNSGMLGPKPVQQSLIQSPAVTQKAEPVEAKPAKSDAAVLHLPGSTEPVEVPAQDLTVQNEQADPITTAAINPQATTDPLLSGQQTEPLNNTAPLAQAAPDLPESIGTEQLRQAALAGDSSAQFIIASRYLEGRAVERNHEAAAHWYMQAANGGLAAAQYRIGTLYERGSGVTQDRFQAMSWYAKAAGQGNVKSMHNLAVMSADTTSGKPDMARAAKWFGAAASHGLPDSQYNLAVLNERGIGVQKNPNEAYKWYSLAAKRGDRDAIAKAEAIKKTMDKTTLAQLDGLIANWKPQAPRREANMVAITNPEWGINPASRQQANASQNQPVPQQATKPVETLSAKDQVKLAQTLLAQKGFDPGAADGQMGSRTANAIRLYQLRNGLPVNGSVSRQLLEHLQQNVG